MPTVQERDKLRHVIQYPQEYSLCTGCSSCEVVCSLMHDGLSSPSYNRIFFKAGATDSMIHTVLTCQHCADHPCYDACPLQDEAMLIDEAGIVYIVEEDCIGCGMCVKACAFEPSRINMVTSKDKAKRKAKKCDLCRTRAEGPACVEWCSAMCLGLSDEPMPEYEAMAATGGAMGFMSANDDEG